MNKFFKYLWYVMRHKYFVFIECCKLGIPFQGLTHDLSKLLPSEWIPYANFFYGKYLTPDEIQSSAIEYRITQPESTESVKNKFDIAWLHHQHRNRHHHQYWLLRNDDGTITALPMPDKYREEMLADWHGAGMAINGINETAKWYLENKKKMTLHELTREWIEIQLGVRCFNGEECEPGSLLACELCLIPQKIK